MKPAAPFDFTQVTGDAIRKAVRAQARAQHQSFCEGLENTAPPPDVVEILKQVGMTPDDVRAAARGMFKKGK